MRADSFKPWVSPPVATGVASLIGPHGNVEVAIGALAFADVPGVGDAAFRSGDNAIDLNLFD